MKETAKYLWGILIGVISILTLGLIKSKYDRDNAELSIAGTKAKSDVIDREIDNLAKRKDEVLNKPIDPVKGGTEEYWKRELDKDED